MKLGVIHGPNLNLLGRREPGIYGSATLDDINAELAATAKELGAEVSFFQSNIEGELVDHIQALGNSGTDGIVINPAAYGHTSVAIRDALLATGISFIEVHLSNIHKREEFRHKTYLSDIAAGIIIGLGKESYLLAMRGLVTLLRQQ